MNQTYESLAATEACLPCNLVEESITVDIAVHKDRVEASINAVERMQDAAQVAIVKADIALRGMRKGADEMQSTVDDIKLCGGLLVERDGKLFFGEVTK